MGCRSRVQNWYFFPQLVAQADTSFCRAVDPALRPPAGGQDRLGPALGGNDGDVHSLLGRRARAGRHSAPETIRQDAGRRDGASPDVRGVVRSLGRVCCAAGRPAQYRHPRRSYLRRRVGSGVPLGAPTRLGSTPQELARHSALERIARAHDGNPVGPKAHRYLDDSRGRSIWSR